MSNQQKGTNNYSEEYSIYLLSKKDSFILRCHTCFSIPIIYINLSNEIPLIKSNCRCEKNKVYKLNDFLEKFNEILLSSFICTICQYHNNNINKNDLELIQSSTFKICLNCKQFYCHKCSEKHQKDDIKGHKLVNLKNFDYICMNDLLDAEAYCKDCNLNICNNCIKNKHPNHHIIKYLDLIVPKELNTDIDKIQRKIELKKDRFLNFINKKEIDSKDINEFRDIFFKNYEINSQLNLLLYCNYKLFSYQKEKNRYNYAGLNNIIQTSNFNFPLIKDNLNGTYLIKYKMISNFYKYDFIINSPVELIETKNKYKLKQTIYSNPYNNNDFILPEQTSVNCLLILSNNLLLSGRDDGNITIYDSSSFSLIKKYKSHNAKINYLIELKNEENESIKICSCSEEPSIKFWNIKYQNDNSSNDFIIKDIIVELLDEKENVHKKGINKIIEIDNNSIASCSFDKKIYFWNKKTYNKIKEIPCINPIMNICKCSNTLIIGENKSDLHFYDLNKEEFDGKMENFPCKNNNCLINIDNNKFIYAGDNGDIYLIQIGTLLIIKQYTVKSSIQTINLLNNGLIILIGNKDGTNLIKIINIYDQKEIDFGKTNSHDIFTSIVQLKEENYIAASSKCGLIEILYLKE